MPYAACNASTCARVLGTRADPPDRVARPLHVDRGMSLRFVLWAVTLLRIVLLPVFLWFALRAQEVAAMGVSAGAQRLGLLAVLLAMGVSDVTDGWMARRYGLTSQIGAVVDAFADKLVQLTVATWFTFMGGGAFARLPLWFFALVVARDVVLGAGWLTFHLGRIPVRVVHRPHGRASSVAVFAVFYSVIVGVSESALTPLLILAALLVMASTAAYVRDGFRQLPRHSLRRSVTDEGR
jgi:cardiolipin synthase